MKEMYTTRHAVQYEGVRAVILSDGVNYSPGDKLYAQKYSEHFTYGFDLFDTEEEANAKFAEIIEARVRRIQGTVEDLELLTDFSEKGVPAFSVADIVVTREVRRLQVPAHVALLPKGSYVTTSVGTCKIGHDLFFNKKDALKQAKFLVKCNISVLVKTLRELQKMRPKKKEVTP